jgi:hypothetical protein
VAPPHSFGRFRFTSLRYSHQRVLQHVIRIFIIGGKILLSVSQVLFQDEAEMVHWPASARTLAQKPQLSDMMGGTRSPFA